MTDTYGTEPHDHESGHDDVLTHGHDDVHEAPSDYEFSDEHGGAAASEEHADEHNSIPADDLPARRSPILPIVAAFSGILLLGGVAWWQFGSGTSAPVAMSSDAPMSVPSLPPLPGTSTATSVPETTVAPKSASAASGLNFPAPDMPKAASIPAPIGVAPVPSAMPPAPAPHMGSLPSLTAQVNTAVDHKTFDGLVLPPVQPSVASPVPSVTPAAAPVAVVSRSNADDERIYALTNRMDALQKSIQQTSDQLGQMANMVTASIGNKQTDERLDKLEQQIAQLKHPAPTLAAPASLPASDAINPTPAPIAKKKAPASVVIYPLTAHITHHAAVHKAKLQEEPKTIIIPVWVLRAASPGQAWVSTNATSHDLKPLRVGDTLAGIGRVTAIQQQGGNWVVQGTSGTLQ
jgi:hypothetical protein